MADFKIPSQPVNLFPMPFANEGAKTIIPDATTLHGRATIPGGFPSETQLPLASGGVAPNRLDFQGILYMLSAFAFWQQSGGLFSYSPALNYTPPALVFHNNVLWWNVAACGPATSAGSVEPGADAAHWIDFLQKLSGGSGGGGLVPVGTVISGWWMEAPDGYFPLDGSEFDPTLHPKLFALLGANILPDRRGLVIRGYDSTGVNDPDGQSRAIGSMQEDKGRNIVGTFTALVQTSSDAQASGAVRIRQMLAPSEDGARRASYETPLYEIDASRSWGGAHTGQEFTGKNFCLLHCIKHD